MAPLNWLILYYEFIILFLLMGILNFYILNYIQVSSGLLSIKSLEGKKFISDWLW